MDGDLTVAGRLQGSLFYGTTGKLHLEVEYDIKKCRPLIPDLRRVRRVDFIGTQLPGLDHGRLTYRYPGREFRLTDVHGEVVREVLG